MKVLDVGCGGGYACEHLARYQAVVSGTDNNRQEKAFDTLDWLAAMTSHIPNHGEQMGRYEACPPLTELLL